MLIFQKFITSPLFLLNSSIFCNMILIEVYWFMDNLKFNYVNVEYDFTFVISHIIQKNYNCDNPKDSFVCAFICR
jgi:hypothetical protein